MPKGPIVTPAVEALIASVYQKHPKWKAPRVRNEVESILRKDNRNSPKGWPSLSTVQKTLATIRKNLANPSPEDEPWSISTLNDYPIPPEALPKVLEEYRLHQVAKNEKPELDEALSRGAWKVFTIRQAKWVARLSASQCEPITPFMIAHSELLHELAGHSPNCECFEIFDKLLAGLRLEKGELMVYIGLFRHFSFGFDHDPGRDINLKKEATNERKHKAKKQE